MMIKIRFMTFLSFLLIVLAFDLCLSQTKYTNPLFQKTVQLRDEGKLIDATFELKDVIKRNRRNAEAYNLLGELYVQLENFEYLKLADQAFDMALRIEPDNPDYLCRYGNLKIKLKEYSRAERLFNRAIKKDPEFYGGYHGIVNLFIDSGSDRFLYKVEEYLIDKIDNTESFDLLLDYGRILLKKNTTEDALNIFSKLENLHPENAMVKFCLSDLNRAIQNYEEASRHYIAGLKNLSDETELEKRYTFMRDLLTLDERSHYKRLTTEERVEFILKFWNKIDPNIITDLNERLVEHFKRVEHALTYFKAGVFPGYDDRGIVYIKYGPPDSNLQLQPEAMSPTGHLAEWGLSRADRMNHGYIPLFKRIYPSILLNTAVSIKW